MDNKTVSSSTKQLLKSFNKVFTHPSVLTVILGFATIILLPVNFNKTIVEQVGTKKLIEGAQIIINDLNNDGQSEEIKMTFNSIIDKMPAIKVFDETGAVYDQWNLSGKWLNIQTPVIGDYDSDGYNEMYIVTKSNDSLFLNGIEFLGNKGHFIDQRFICKSKFHKNGNIDVSLFGGGFFDYNQDNKKDLYFILYAGFSKYPRNIFRYDIENDSLVVSPFSGTGINYLTFIMDLDGDQKNEIFGSVSAHGNYTEDVPFKDSSCYLMVFDQNLNFKFEPVEFKGYPGIIFTYPYYQNEEFYLMCLYKLLNAKTDKKYKLLLFDIEGNLLFQKKLPNSKNVNGYSIVPIDLYAKKELILTNISGQIFKIRFPIELQEIDIPFSFKGISGQKPVYFDVDNDGQEEILLFANGNENILVLNKDYKLYTSLDIPSDSSEPFAMYPTTEPDGKKFLYVQVGKKFYSFEFIDNPLYLWQYPIYLLIFILLYLFFYYLNKIQKRLAKEKYENEKEMIKLQYASIKNQIDPHFILNVLNSISGMYGNRQKEEADNYLAKFGKLIHQSLMNSDKISVSLREELEFTRNFIEIQMTRFGNCFDYSIEVDEDVKLTTEIPRMLIHTFVENAIKHGLRPKKEDGFLSITALKKGKKIFIEIKDNGIGRKQSQAQKTQGTGKGIGIIDNILELYKKLTGKKIKYEVVDIEGPNNKTGTRIEIEMAG